MRENCLNLLEWYNGLPGLTPATAWKYGTKVYFFELRNCFAFLLLLATF